MPMPPLIGLGSHQTISMLIIRCPGGLIVRDANAGYARGIETLRR
jgi:hypothetical protein